MRQGVKWQPIAPVNGRVLDMDDWRTSQERHLAAGFYRVALGDLLDKTEFPDARRMVWRLKAPFAPIFDRIYHDKFAFPIQPKELNANVALAEQTAIGTGYKILDKHQPAITMNIARTRLTGVVIPLSTAGTSQSFLNTPTATPSLCAATSQTLRLRPAMSCFCTRTLPAP